MTGRDHGGRMLARRWTIAANYREPADFGIPETPTFEPCHTTCGRVAFYPETRTEPNTTTEPVLVADSVSRVRR